MVPGECFELPTAAEGSQARGAGHGPRQALGVSAAPRMPANRPPHQGKARAAGRESTALLAKDLPGFQRTAFGMGVGRAGHVPWELHHCFPGAQVTTPQHQSKPAPPSPITHPGGQVGLAASSLLVPHQPQGCSMLCSTSISSPGRSAGVLDYYWHVAAWQCLSQEMGTLPGCRALPPHPCAALQGAALQGPHCMGLPRAGWTSSPLLRALLLLCFSAQGLQGDAN